MVVFPTMGAHLDRVALLCNIGRGARFLHKALPLQVLEGLQRIQPSLQQSQESYVSQY